MPIVLAACLRPAGRRGDPARAILAARREPAPASTCPSDPNAALLSPLNVKFERVAAGRLPQLEPARPRAHGERPGHDALASRPRGGARALERAINRTAVLRVYPGMRGDLPDRPDERRGPPLRAGALRHRHGVPAGVAVLAAQGLRRGQGARRALLLHLAAGGDRRLLAAT